MLTSPDFKDLLNLLKKHKVKYLVIGGYAVMKYTEPRFTKDLDLFVSTETKNAKAIYTALKEFGAPLKNLTEIDFTQKGYFYQMGAAPIRIDILMSVKGIDFKKAWKNKEVVRIADDFEINFISREDLIKTKEASGRPQDLIDLKNLRETNSN